MYKYGAEGCFLLLMDMSHYRRVVIILEIDVIKPAKDVAGRIGDPTPYTEGKSLKYTSLILQQCSVNTLMKWD